MKPNSTIRNMRKAIHMVEVAFIIFSWYCGFTYDEQRTEYFETWVETLRENYAFAQLFKSSITKDMPEESHVFYQVCSKEEGKVFESFILSDLIPTYSRMCTRLLTKRICLLEKHLWLLHTRRKYWWDTFNLIFRDPHKTEQWNNSRRAPRVFWPIWLKSNFILAIKCSKSSFD